MDSVVYPHTGSTAIEKEISSPPMPLVGVGTHYLVYRLSHHADQAQADLH